MRPLSSLPWTTHAVLMIVCPLLLVLRPLLVHGSGPADGLPSGLLMSYGFYLFAWLVTAPLICIEVFAVSRLMLPAARVSAVLAHLVLALVGTLPVTLHHVLALSDADPVGLDVVRSATASYALLLAGYFLTLVAVSGTRPRASPTACAIERRSEVN